MILSVLEQEAVTELERQDLGQKLERPSLNYKRKAIHLFKLPKYMVSTILEWNGRD